MNSEQIFGLALGLSDPWFIEIIDLTNELSAGSFKELHIYINFRKGFKFQTVGSSTSSAYDTEDRTWQQPDFSPLLFSSQLCPLVYIFLQYKSLWARSLQLNTR